jgi:sigma-B regulation protein RsbU (phosphoserine phosphatase)
MAGRISTLESPKLRALFDQGQIESWLQTFSALDAGLTMAIIDSDGRLFAQSGDWDEFDLATLSTNILSEPGDGTWPISGYHCWPLKVAGKPTGTLAIGGRDDPRSLTIGQIAHHSLMLLLDEAGQKQELAAGTLERSQELDLLQELLTIGKELSAMLELEPLLSRILRAAIDLTHTEEGAFFLVDEPSGDLIFRVVDGGPQELLGRRVPFGQGIVGQAAATGEPQIVNDVQENKDWFDAIDKMRDFMTQSLLAVPLLKQDEPVGVLEVINRKDGRPFSQQDAARLTALASQSVVALETARLHQAELAKQRMERELQLGRTMQSSLIPSTVPTLNGWEFAAWWKPAREVSGDFYDFIPLDDKIGVVMADVSDKGVHAALFMALSRSIIRASLNALREPAVSICEANRLISQDAKDGMFVTMCYAQFTPDSGDITYVNAGHNPPLWYRAEHQDIVELGPTGIILGFDAGLPCEEKSICCGPDDVLVLYTDGVTEAMNAKRMLFGEERFQEILLQNHDRPPAEILAAIKEALKEHVRNAPQFDDITLVIAKHNGKET